MKALSEQQTKQYCVFKSANYTFAAPVESIQEIVSEQAITPVPLAPEQILGLLNVRGQIITVISLAKRFNLGGEAQQAKSYILFRVKDEIVGVAVDEVADIIEIESNKLDPVPEVISEEIRGSLTAIYKAPKGLILILDITKTTEIER